VESRSLGVFREKRSAAVRKRVIFIAVGVIVGSISSAAFAQLSPPFRPGQPQTATTQVPEVKAWVRYQMIQLLDISHAMAVTYIEYPKGWQAIPDYHQRSVTFAEDPEGTISFTICPWMELVDPREQTASQFFQALLAEMSQRIPDLQIVEQQFSPIQNLVGGMISEGIVQLRGTENGTAMTYETSIWYRWVSGYSYDVANTMFGFTKAPKPQFPNIKRYIFDHMTRSFMGSIPEARSQKE